MLRGHYRCFGSGICNNSSRVIGIPNSTSGISNFGVYFGCLVGEKMQEDVGNLSFDFFLFFIIRHGLWFVWPADEMREMKK